MSILIAIDPGLVTGYATFNTDMHPPLRFISGELPTRYYVYDAIRRLRAEKGVELVTERFTIHAETHKLTPQPDAMMINGWLDGEAHHRGWKFTQQTSGKAKSFATDEKLKALGWWRPTPDGHANDASRHLLTYLVDNYRKPGEPGFVLMNRLVETLDI